MAPKSPYESKRVRHAPKTVVTRSGPQQQMAGEPLCGKPFGPGTTTIVLAMVNCPDCTMMLAEGYAK